MCISKWKPLHFLPFSAAQICISAWCKVPFLFLFRCVQAHLLFKILFTDFLTRFFLVILFLLLWKCGNLSCVAAILFAFHQINLVLGRSYVLYWLCKGEKKSLLFRVVSAIFHHCVQFDADLWLSEKGFEVWTLIVAGKSRKKYQIFVGNWRR